MLSYKNIWRVSIVLALPLYSSFMESYDLGSPEKYTDQDLQDLLSSTFKTNLQDIEQALENPEITQEQKAMLLQNGVDSALAELGDYGMNILDGLAKLLKDLENYIKDRYNGTISSLKQRLKAYRVPLLLYARYWGTAEQLLAGMWDGQEYPQAHRLQERFGRLLTPQNLYQAHMKARGVLTDASGKNALPKSFSGIS